VTITSIKNGKYKLKIFHTWRGEFIQEKEVVAADNTLVIALPTLKTTGGHANYLGQDVAFILESISEPPPPTSEKAKKKK